MKVIFTQNLKTFISPLSSRFQCCYWEVYVILSPIFCSDLFLLALEKNARNFRIIFWIPVYWNSHWCALVLVSFGNQSNSFNVKTHPLFWQIFYVISSLMSSYLFLCSLLVTFINPIHCSRSCALILWVSGIYFSPAFHFLFFVVVLISERFFLFNLSSNPSIQFLFAQSTLKFSFLFVL